MSSYKVASYARPFGKNGVMVSPEDLSVRLIAFAAMRIQNTNGGRRPTQKQIADELLVSQPMIHGVLFKAKSFGREKFKEYAGRIAMPEDRLVRELLNISREDDFLENSQGVKLATEEPGKAVLDIFMKATSRIEMERSRASVNPDFAFDCDPVRALRLAFRPHAGCPSRGGASWRAPVNGT